MPLDAGEPAPEISLPNQDGETAIPDLSTPTVLYFYPEDGTPGCTTEAEQFEMESTSYEDAGVAVYGISTDDVDSHAQFAAERGIKFDLLADPDGEVVDTYGVERDPSNRATRTTFVVDDGEVQTVYETVDPEGHARDVLLDMLEDGLVEL